MAVSSVLDIARGALFAQETAMGVAANNIANTNTPGYTRQVAEFQAQPDASNGFARGGRGVAVKDIRQILDPFVDRRLLVARTDSAGKTIVSDQLATLAGTLNDVNSPSLGSLLDDFFGAADTLAQNPQDLSSRQGLLGAAGAVANEFNRLSAALAAQQRDLDAMVVQKANQANDDLTKIAALNTEIVAAKGNAGAANALLDQRRAMLDDLAQKLPVTQVEDQYGAVTVMAANGTVLVTAGTVVNAIATQPDPGNPAALGANTLHAVGFRSASGVFLDVPAAFSSGELAGLLRVRDQDLVTASQNLDQLAGTFATAVNAVQTAGLDFNGAAGTPMFTGTTAQTIAVALTDPKLIAAALSTQPGDNQNALALADLRTTTQGALGTTFAGYMALETERLGNDAALAHDMGQASQLVTRQIESERASISGVNTDEEMTNLLALQRAYQAAARLISVVDTTLDTLLQIT